MDEGARLLEFAVPDAEPRRCPLRRPPTLTRLRPRSPSRSAVTSTVSGSGDQLAEPDKLVAVSDRVRATSPAPWERFWTVRGARSGQVFRGVSFTPGTESESGH